MKFNLITLLTSSVALVAALWMWSASVVGFSTHGHYYVTAIMFISCTLAVITLFRLFQLYRRRPLSAVDADRDVSDRLRQHYRIQFDESPHPIFVQRTDESQRATAFTCRVHDISETGISLNCAGVYTHGQTVQGEIIFDSGRTTPVNGVVIREGADRTCLRLHCTIDPPLLMAEQREQIVMEKANGPRPAVNKTTLDTAAGSLPSHSPKGICRLKPP